MCFVLEPNFPQLIGYRLWLPAGLIATPVVFVAALTVQREHGPWRWVGFAAMAVFALWACLPRL